LYNFLSSNEKLPCNEKTGQPPGGTSSKVMHNFQCPADAVLPKVRLKLSTLVSTSRMDTQLGVSNVNEMVLEWLDGQMEGQQTGKHLCHRIYEIILQHPPFHLVL